MYKIGSGNQTESMSRKTEFILTLVCDYTLLDVISCYIRVKIAFSALAVNVSGTCSQEDEEDAG